MGLVGSRHHTSMRRSCSWSRCCRNTCGSTTGKSAERGNWPLSTISHRRHSERHAWRQQCRPNVRVRYWRGHRAVGAREGGRRIGRRSSQDTRPRDGRRHSSSTDTLPRAVALPVVAGAVVKVGSGSRSVRPAIAGADTSSTASRPLLHRVANNMSATRVGIACMACRPTI